MKIFGKERDLDGIFKNISVVYSEITENWPKMAVYFRMVRDAKGFKEKTHKVANVIKESFQFFPRTWLYTVIIMFLVIFLQVLF